MEKRKKTALLPLLSWRACWNDTCPFITGEIGSEEEEGIASAGLLWLCQLLGNRRQEWKRGAAELRLHILPVKSKSGSFTKAVELLLNMPLRATANILAARSVYLMTSTPDGEACKLW